LQTLHWNYCAYTTDSASLENTYAYVALTSPDRELAIATGAIPRIGSTNVRNAADDTIGISFTQTSTTPCRSKLSTMFDFTTKLICDEEVTGDAVVTSVTVDTCTYTVTLKHKEGCSDVAIDIDAAMGWF